MWISIGLPLLIGIAIFLFGMKVMEFALHQWGGAYLKTTMQRFTKTPLHGLLTGTTVTAALQSSSAVTVVTIGMVNAGILTFPKTLGIILGTNIGTVVTTELIGLNITHIASPLLIYCIILWLVSWLVPARSHAKLQRGLHTIRCFIMAAAGFACILLGMEVMQSIVPALKERGLFSWFVDMSMQSLIWGIIAGTMLTAIIQSSSATIAIAMGLASAQAIAPELGIAIVLGANIGTCFTALLASIGGTRAGQFVAWSHVLLNFSGAILFYPLIPYLYIASAWLSDSPSSQLAHAQTIYNITCSLLALPLCYLPSIQRMQSSRQIH